MTDSGLCYVYNGEALTDTYAESTRISELADALDRRSDVRIKKIEGTGQGYKKTFWLNIGDR